jgi:hypothetical protein
MKNYGRIRSTIKIHPHGWEQSRVKDYIGGIMFICHYMRLIKSERLSSLAVAIDFSYTKDMDLCRRVKLDTHLLNFQPDAMADYF